MTDPKIDVTLRPDLADTGQPWPIEKVRLLATNVNELLALKDQQLVTMAKMLRQCIAAIRRTPTSWDGRAERLAIASDRAKSFLYLEYLATQMENQSVRSSDTN